MVGKNRARDVSALLALENHHLGVGPLSEQLEPIERTRIGNVLPAPPLLPGIAVFPPCPRPELLLTVGLVVAADEAEPAAARIVIEPYRGRIAEDPVMHARSRNRVGNGKDGIPVVVFGAPACGAASRLLALVLRQRPEAIIIHGGDLHHRDRACERLSEPPRAGCSPRGTRSTRRRRRRVHHGTRSRPTCRWTS
jgi:hypothetical protein